MIREHVNWKDNECLSISKQDFKRDTLFKISRNAMQFWHFAFRHTNKAKAQV